MRKITSVINAEEFLVWLQGLYEEDKLLLQDTEDREDKALFRGRMIATKEIAKHVYENMYAIIEEESDYE